MWIGYALIRRLADSLPTLILNGGNYYSFTSDGVLCHGKSPAIRPNFHATEEQPIWCLIDSVDSKGGLPSSLTGHLSFKILPIYVSSPTVGRWAKLEQSKKFRVVYMNDWCLDEIEAL